jgi:hypothetical protein
MASDSASPAKHVRHAGERAVSRPIVFISHFQVKSGGLDEYRRLADEVTRQLESKRPGLPRSSPTSIPRHPA